jgi:malate dehydrogenase (oxaloacetate-decarboxylating)(NADP+)
MAAARVLLRNMHPGLEVEGEMHGDAAVNETIRQIVFPNAELRGVANLLVMPNVDAANITFNLLKHLSNGVSISPILLGLRKPVHIIHAAVRTRGVVNLTAAALARVNNTATA